MTRTVHIATCLRRKEHLQTCINSIKNVDRIIVYANDYEPNVVGAEVVVLDSDIGARAKFTQTYEGINYTCDDDLIYHKDYFDTLANRLKEKEFKVVAGLHGSYYKRFPVPSYFWAQETIHFSEGIKADKYVFMLGTGALAYHSSLINAKDIEFKHNNCVDIEFAKHCFERKIPRLCIGRPRGFAMEIKGSQKNTIWQGASLNDRIQTDILNSLGKNILKNIRR